MAEQKKLGWFTTPGRLGDRTLESQLIGLDRLLRECDGQTILDVGCAEGLIGMELARRGARLVHGVEVVPGHIDVAKELRGDLPCSFEVANANSYEPQGQFDTVLMLAVLHKLKDPSAACKRFAAAARRTVVIRLPPYGLVIVDSRSENVPHDIGLAMADAGFTLDEVVAGPREEWLGYFVRTEPLADAPVEEAAIPAEALKQHADSAGQSAEPAEQQAAAPADGEQAAATEAPAASGRRRRARQDAK